MILHSEEVSAMRWWVLASLFVTVSAVEIGCGQSNTTASAGRTASATSSGSSVSNPSCTLSGTFRHDTAGVGNATIQFTPLGRGRFRAVETGLGDFTGTATFVGSTLRIEWTTEGASGVYTWSMDDTCNRGEGQLVFTSG